MVRATERRTVKVKHGRKTLEYVFPFGPGSHRKVEREIEREGLRPANFDEVVPLVCEDFFRKGGDENLGVMELLEEGVVWGFDENLYRIDGSILVDGKREVAKDFSTSVQTPNGLKRHRYFKTVWGEASLGKMSKVFGQGIVLDLYMPSQKPPQEEDETRPCSLQLHGRLLFVNNATSEQRNGYGFGVRSS